MPDPCAGRTCGGSCGTCANGFQCVSGRCDLDPASSWVLTVTTGTVTAQGAGGPWDPLGGAPDPQVCLTISGRLQCTAYAADTFSATWNHPIATTAGALQAGVPSSYLDYDTGSFSDPICSGVTLVFARDVFTAGGGYVSCANGRWNFTLRPR